MRVTMNEFARKYGISDRHARRLLADNEADLVGHFERRGGKATLIDEVAEKHLANQLRNPVSVMPEEAPKITEREATLIVELANVNARLADAERRAGEGSSAIALLGAAESKAKELEASVASLARENGVLSAERDQARVEASAAATEAQKASQRLTEAEEEIRRMKAATLWQRLRGFK